uniref:Uncharacterized protein n=1 Tax=Octopus bimaculoides TaxID=37653 RepID=A0A0L8GSY8_OCTBM
MPATLVPKIIQAFCEYGGNKEDVVGEKGFERQKQNYKTGERIKKIEKDGGRERKLEKNENKNGRIRELEKARKIKRKTKGVRGTERGRQKE